MLPLGLFPARAGLASVALEVAGDVLVAVLDFPDPLARGAARAVVYVVWWRTGEVVMVRAAFPRSVCCVVSGRVVR